MKFPLPLLFILVVPACQPDDIVYTDAGSGSQTTYGSTMASYLKFSEQYLPQYHRDVYPLLRTLGCATATCHDDENTHGLHFGHEQLLYSELHRTAQGSGGGIRLNSIVPEESLLLTKALLPSEKGRTEHPDIAKGLTTNSDSYRLILLWIELGAQNN